MSKYLKIETRITDGDMLAQALEEVRQRLAFGFERHDIPVPLVGWQGKERQELAEFVIRRSYLDKASNDMGWLRGEEGFTLVLSQFDKHGERAREIATDVQNTYTFLEAAEKARQKGYTVTPRKDEQGRTVELKLRKY